MLMSTTATKLSSDAGESHPDGGTVFSKVKCRKGAAFFYHDVFHLKAFCWRHTLNKQSLFQN